MTTRYQLLQNPQAQIYETPAQAYMIIEGVPTRYECEQKVINITRKRSSGSVGACYHCYCHCSKSKGKKTGKQCIVITDTSRSKGKSKKKDKAKRKRLESYDSFKRQWEERNFYKQQQKYDKQQQERQRLRQRKSYKPIRRPQQQAFSFRDININQAKNQITCNYKKMMQQQNICLRKQNKFLQQYIQTLQSKYTRSPAATSKFSSSGNFKKQQLEQKVFKNSGGWANQTKNSNDRSGGMEAGRTSFRRGNGNSNSKNTDTEDGSSTFTNKIYSTRGESQWPTGYR